MNFAKFLKTKILSKLLALAVLISVAGIYPMQLAMASIGSVVGSQSQVPNYIGKGATRVELLKVTINQGDPVDLNTLDKIEVTMMNDWASVVAAGGVLLIRDNGSTTDKIDVNDTQVANASISGGVATINLGDPLRGVIGTIPAGGSLTYFIAINVAADAPTGNTVDAKIEAGDITFNQDTSPLPLPSGAALSGSQYITVDATAPAISLMQTIDNDGNGQLDHIKITTTDTNGLDDNFTGLTVVVDTYTVTDYVTSLATGSEAGLSTAYDNIFYATITEKGPGQEDTGVKPNVNISANTTLSDYYSNGTYNIDLGNNMATTIAAASTDLAKPVLISAASTNILQAGNVKASSGVTLTFSESVTAASPTFTLTTQRYATDTPQTYTQDSFDGTTVSINNGSATTRTLTFAGATTSSDPAFTMGEGQTQGYWTTGAQFKFAAIGAGTLKDAANLDVNTSGGYVSLAAEDGTAPITVKVVGYDDGSLAGLANDGKLDRIEMYFNEALTSDTYETADFTTLTVNNGAGDQALTLSSAAASTTNNLVVLDLTGSVSGTGNITLIYKDDTNAGGHDIKDVSAVKYSNGDAKTQTAIDAVKPVIVAVTNYDVDTDGGAAAANGKNDEILITFSEDVDDSSFAAGTDITVNGTGVKFEVPASTQNAGDTTNIADDYLLTVVNNTQASEFTGTAKVAVVILGSGISDLVTPTANINTSQTFAADATGNSDNSAPIIIGSEYRDDTGTDGAVDKVRLTFSEPITYSAFENGDWTETANGITNLNVSAGTASASTTLDLTATANAGITGGIAPTIGYVVAGNDVTDGVNNLAAVTSTLTDAAAPVKVSMTLQDANTNGKVDKVVVTYSEDLVATTATTSWAVTNIPSNGTFDSVSELAGVITLAIVEGTSTADTSVGLMKVALDNTAEIADATGNVAADFAVTSPTDLAGPVLLDFKIGDKAVTPELFNEIGDVVKMVFSETLKTGNVPGEINSEAAFVFTGATTTDGDNFPTQVGGDTIIAYATTNQTNDTIVYSFSAEDTSSGNPLDDGDADLKVDKAAGYVAGSIVDAADVNFAGTYTGLPITHTSLDVTPPTITSVTTKDLDSNGMLDALYITFDAAVDDSSVNTANIAFGASGYTVNALHDGAEFGGLTGNWTGAFHTGTTTDDRYAYIAITKAGQTYDTGVSGASLASDAAAGFVSDIAGNAMENIAAVNGTDGASPVFVSAAAVSNIRVQLTFSEQVAVIGATLFKINGDPGIGTGAASDADTTKVNVAIGAGLNNTAFTSNDLDVLANAVADIGTANANVEILNRSITDGQAPTLVSAETQDIGTDGLTRNGKVDHLKLTFSENIDDGAINNYNASANYLPTTLAVANVSDEAVDYDADAVNNNVLYIIFTEGAAADTGVMNQDITWTGASATIKDFANPANQAGDLASGGVTEADAAAPVIVAAATGEEDVTVNSINHDVDGYLDKLVLTYSESVDVGTSIGGQFDVANTAGNTLDAEYVADGDDGNTTVTVYFTSSKSAYDTNGTPNIVFTATTSAVVATVGGQDAPTQIFSGTTDSAGPVLVAVASDRALSSSNVPDGAIWTMTYSEIPTVGTVVDEDFVFDKDGTGGTVVWDRDGATVAYTDSSDNDMTMTFTAGTSGGSWATSSLWNLVAGGTANITNGGNNAQPRTIDLTVSGLQDTNPPTITSVTTLDDGNGKIDQIKVVFDERMNEGITSVTGFTVDGYAISGATGAWSTTSVASDTFTFALTENTFDTGATPNVSYASTTGAMRDLSGNAANNRVATAATDGAKPAFASAVTGDSNNDGSVDRLVITFSENVDITDGDAENGLPGITLSAGTIANSNYAASNTSTLSLVISGITNTRDTINPTYSVAGAGQIDEAAATNAEMVNAETVTGADGAAPVIIAVKNYDNATADGTNDEVYITFSEILEDNTTLAGHLGTVTYGGSTGTISLKTSGTNQTDNDGDQYITLEQNDNTGGFGNTDTNQLVFSGATIADRAAVTPNVFIAQTVLATSGVATVTDTAIPVLMSSSCADTEPDGKINTCTLTYSETLTTQAVTTVTAKGNAGAAVVVSSAAALGANVTVTLDNADANNWTGVIQISYTVGNGITDGTNNAAGLTNEALTDDVAPFALLTDASTKSNPNDVPNGYTKNITIKYSEDISTSTPSVNGFTVLNSANAAVTISTTSVSTNTLTLTLAQSGNNNTSKMSVAYSASSATIKVIDALGNQALLFNDTEITDNVAPALMSAIPLTSSTIKVTFSEPLDRDTVAGAGTDFSVTGYAITNAYTGSGSADVVLTTATPFNWDTLVADGSKVYLIAGQSVNDLNAKTLNGEKSVDITDGTKTLTSIDVTPDRPTIRKGDTFQFTATGFYSDGSNADITTSSVVWTSSNTNAATINATSGVATGVLENQSTVIRATLGSVFGTETLKVENVTLSSITVTPATPSIVKGATQQFQTTGTWSDGSTSTVTQNTYWTSSDTGVATIDANTGLATAVATGTVTITAVSGGKTNTAALIVSAATVASVAVTPATVQIAKGTSQQFVAIATYTDGTTSTVTTDAGTVWNSSNEGAATVATTTGLAASVAEGSTVIRATFGGQSGIANLTVTNANLSSITVTPATPSIVKGATQQFQTTGTWSDGSTTTVTQNTYWTSSNGAIATIDANTGLATAVATGTVTITARSGIRTATAELIVSAATVSSVAVTPATVQIAKGTSQQFVAIATYTDGTTSTVTTDAGTVWNSSNEGAATVATTTGLAASVAEGSTVIRATFGGQSGIANLTVTNANLSSITIEATGYDYTAALPIGDGQMFKATGTYSDNTAADITPNVIWISSNEDVAYFNEYWDVTGEIIVARAVGTTSITAALNGTTSNAITVTVTGYSTAPTVTSPATAVSVSSTSYTITGTSTANAAISVCSGQGSCNSGTANGSGIWSVTVSLNSGTNNFTVHAQESGKADSTSVTVPAITQDNNSPSVMITSPTNGNTNDTTPLLAYETEAGAVIVVKLDGVTTTIANGGSFATSTEGPHTVIVQATDAAGNTGSNSVTFTIDTSVPGSLNANPSSGVYNETQTVLLENGNGTVYYTTNGSTPGTSSAVYTAAGITVSSDTVVKAVCLNNSGTLGSVSTFTYILKTDLDGITPQTIVLKAGKWNIFSVPKTVATFTAFNTISTTTSLTGLTASQLGIGGAAYLMEGNAWKRLTTDVIANSGHAHYGKEVPQPLYGYVIKNMSEYDITLTIAYDATLASGITTFQRNLAQGWNSVGVADYQGALSADSTSTINVDTSDGMGGMSSLGYVLDYTANANDSSVNFASAAARLRRSGYDASTINIINPRETRGYLISSQAGSFVGTQLVLPQ